MGMRQAFVLILACGMAVATAENNGALQRRGAHGTAAPVDRIIIGLHSGPKADRVGAAVDPDRMQALARRSSVRFRAERSLGPALQVVELESPVTGADLDDTLARLASDPEVAFVEPDRRAFAHAIAADAFYPAQWYLQSAQPSAIDAETAWDLTTGSAATVVAVLDTGVRFDHPDLLQAGRGGRLLPGFDFVSGDADGAFVLANDGDGWDANPSDPGDWVTAAEAPLPLFAPDCDPDDSSWHGTRVAGLIGAIANNGVGIAGATWSTWILPVRVLGKCYGRNSDILQGMRWAAGLPVAGVPPNPYPAQVINLSLGTEGSCTASYLSVVNELAQVGVLVVASAGNSGGPVEYPANCAGVTAVASLRHVGTKVGFSSLGPQVALSAPGGNCVNDAPAPCLFSLDTTYDMGATVAVAPGYTDMLHPNVGTSFSAPFVAGIAALMRAVNGNLRGAQLGARLRESARPFPPPADGVPLCHVPVSSADTQKAECGCTTSTCGAGMAHAPAAVSAALRPIAAVALPATVAAGQNVSLDASLSAAACGRSVASFAWTAVAGSPAISGADTAVATLVAPAAGSVTVRVTVTDDQGAQDIADIIVTSSAATSAAPADAGANACPVERVPTDPGPFVDDGPPASLPSGGTSVPGSGGGGGAPGPLELLLLAAVALQRYRSAGFGFVGLFDAARSPK